MSQGKFTLDVIQVPDPCPEKWDGMRGDDRVRFCGICHQNVFNLSAMRADEANALLEEHLGQVCVRFFRRADGTITTLDCAPDRLAALRRRARRTLGLAGGAVAAVMTAIGALGFAAVGAFGEEIENLVKSAEAHDPWTGYDEVEVAGGPMYDPAWDQEIPETDPKPEPVVPGPFD